MSADDNVEAELGVVEPEAVAFVVEKELSIERPRRGFGGRCEAGAAEAGAS